MHFLGHKSGLYTDLYELTMAQGYYSCQKKDEKAVFDYFFRANPFDGGYAIFAGLQDLLDELEHFSFDDAAINYLADQGFTPSFLEFLKDFSFRGTIHSVQEGEVVFPNEPILRVEGTLLETQLIETIVLNILNFESLIATKASRMREVADDRIFADFGLRRAQGFGGIHASRAAVIGGANSTSNVYAGYHYDIPISGTQAHSWVQSFDDELTAFRTYAQNFPNKCILLVDTYNTLESGIPNAITVAKELEENGHKLVGVRLDSGDLAYLSKKARQMLDEAGLEYVKILASNQLDEYVIRSLIQQQAPIDGFGVGTRLITGNETPALDGVYKLSRCAGKPRLKLSENIEKITLPGTKQMVRYLDEEDQFYADGILLASEGQADRIYHPNYPEKNSTVKQYATESLFVKVMEEGKKMSPLHSTQESAAYAQKRLAQLRPEHKRFENPHIYKVGVSQLLLDLRNKIMQQLKNEKTIIL